MTSYDKQEGTDRPLHDASLREVQLASTTQAHALGGGSVSTETANNPVGQHELAEWYSGLSFTADASAPQLAGGFTPQVGPLNTGYIAFNGGVPVGGFAQLTLFQSGNFNFNGHFHVSGAPSYNVGFAVGVRSSRGVLYTFLRSGHVAGTFEPGSRDFDWSVQEFRAVIAEGLAESRCELNVVVERPCELGPVGHRQFGQVAGGDRRRRSVSNRPGLTNEHLGVCPTIRRGHHLPPADGDRGCNKD